MNAPSLIWPVYGHNPREDVAWFFEWGDAASFAMRPTDFGAEKRNLYVGTPMRRPLAEWQSLTDVEHLGPGRIAA